MMKQMEEMNLYMQQAKAAAAEKTNALTADGRADEARAYRASFNIYDVFAALLNAAVKTSGGDEDRMKEAFHKLAEKIPESWRQSLAAARQHADAEKVMIEEAKLTTAAEITEKFDSLF